MKSPMREIVINTGCRNFIREKEHGIVSSLSDCINEMRAKGIWISDELARRAMMAVGESSLKN